MSPSLGPDRSVVEATGVDIVEFSGADSCDDGYGGEKRETKTGEELKNWSSIFIRQVCLYTRAAISAVNLI